MNYRTIARSIFVLAVLSIAACAGEVVVEPDRQTEDLRTQADRLALEMLIVDTHIDVPYRMANGVEDISQRTEGGDFDYPRAKQGGLDAPFMSIYVPASYQAEGGAKEFADELIDMVEGFEESWPDKFAVAKTSAEVEAIAAEGKIALPMGMENGAPVEDDLANLRHFFDRGIRYITLTHSENNQICDSSYSEERQWNGLSPFGREVVAEMNRLGIMIDVSHVSDDAFYQVMELSTAPVIASHSSARRYTPDFERNMDDDMIRLLAEKGGVIHINFGSAFLDAEAREKGQALWAALRTYAEENQLQRGDPELQEYMEHYRQENPPVFADISDVVAHIDHVVDLVGIDHVGLGSDFDGVGDSLPTGLKDVSMYPNLIYELLKKGYSEDDVKKILSGNLMRVWRQVEAVAAAAGSANRAAA
ncbi:MAG: dipeptidase [Acidobacteriota bacterium]